MFKRALDLLFAAAGLILASPLFVVTAVAIKIGSPGPVLYRAPRLGRFGRPFFMLKFRTMVANADQIGQPATPEGDPRVTRVGHLLRRFKIDELPQLINVVWGEMSLVGPRPEAALFFEYYSPEEKQTVLSVRPGMTDWASIRFHDEGRLIVGDDPVKIYLETIKDEKVKMQMEYVRSHSCRQDLRIIIATLQTVVESRLRRS